MNYFSSEQPRDRFNQITYDAYVVVHLLYRSLVKFEVKTDKLVHHYLAILAMIHQHDLLPTMEVAKRLSLSKPQMSQFVDRLSAKGLIERVTDDKDKRKVLLRLTTEGERVFGEYQAQVRTNLVAKIGKLKPQEVDKLAEALKTIIKIATKIEQED